MKKNNDRSSRRKAREILLSPTASIVMFLLAAGLLLFSGIGGARAALTYVSDFLASQYGMYHIGVTLIENDQDVSHRNYVSHKDDATGKMRGAWDEVTGVLLGHMLDKKDAEGKTMKDEKGNILHDDLKIGMPYEERIKVRNSSGETDSDNPGINEFVRVTIYKYWMDKSPYEGSPEKDKDSNLDPSLIKLHLVNTSEDGGKWIIDKKASTDERIVAYYSDLLLAYGDKKKKETDELTDTLTIDTDVVKKVHKTEEKDGNGKVITTIYDDYEGKSFCIEATVDAVQQHSAKEAIQSAWGRNVTISGTGDDMTLSLED